MEREKGRDEGGAPRWKKKQGEGNGENRARKESLFFWKEKQPGRRKLFPYNSITPWYGPSSSVKTAGRYGIVFKNFLLKWFR